MLWRARVLPAKTAFPKSYTVVFVVWLFRPYRHPVVSAPAAAVPAMCTAAHARTLMLALGSRVPILHTSLLFEAAYL
jgi:hypothetical protein